MELEVFTRETYKLILTTYIPLKLRISVYKLLGHTLNLIALNDNYSLGTATVSRGTGIEACNKTNKKCTFMLDCAKLGLVG